MGLILAPLGQMVILRFHDVFPVRLIWLTSVSAAVGGGNAVLLGIVFSIVTDATSERGRFVSSSFNERLLATRPNPFQSHCIHVYPRF